MSACEWVFHLKEEPSVGPDDPGRTTRKLLKNSLLAGMAGAFLFPLAMALEESLGLEILFHLRGARTPPQEVLIVSADRYSSAALSLHDDPQKWPRWIHAGLTETVAGQGAEVIVFNLLFSEPRNPKGEEEFAKAIAQAGNVVLCQGLQRERRVLHSAGGGGRSIEIERLISPIPPLSESAAGLAPFAIPKVPIKVSGSWTFKDQAGEVPSLPVLAFQVFSRPTNESLAAILRKHCPATAGELSGEIRHPGAVESVCRTLRGAFTSREFPTGRVLAELASMGPGEPAGGLGRALVELYRGPEFRYLNFYGPAGTIPTVSYLHALDPAANGIDFRGKAVFVGIAENLHPENQEGFYTVYSGSDGIDLSGVEIAATMFANILENSFLRPLSLYGQLLLVLLWGGLLWSLFATLPLGRAMSGAAALASIYLLGAVLLFRGANIWVPIVVPLAFQVPLTALWSFTRTFSHTKKERENIRKAFGYHLPEHVVDQMARDAGRIGKERQIVKGICICTDAQSYTSLAELLEPEELSELMNRYYSSIFEPVVRHGGLISDVVGDSMMAVWTARPNDPTEGTRACQAALEISECAEEYSSISVSASLQTRIGLAAGQMVLGHVGAGSHFEYRAVGDTVNSANRLEGLNKVLGTRIIASRAVVMRTPGMLFRPLGVFLLPGKTQPLEVYELVCSSESATEEQKRFSTLFTEGLRAFAGKQWTQAEALFKRCLESREGRDGPSLFYLSLCRKHQELEPEDWRGVVTIHSK
jgi:adenylate cyclase